MRFHLIKITLNFSAVVFLVALIVTPIYFARNFAKVAGAKSEANYLIVSQIEKFPNLVFAQQDDKYRIGFAKQGPSQAFLGILIINNPTIDTQEYKLQVTNGSARPFFGDDIDNQIEKIALPGTVSVPISLYSGPESTAASQLVEFKITAGSE